MPLCNTANQVNQTLNDLPVIRKVGGAYWGSSSEVDTAARPGPRILINDLNSLARAIQKRRDVDQPLMVVTKSQGRLLGPEQQSFSQIVPAWMKMHGFSFASMENADVVVAHESFMPFVLHRTFREVTDASPFEGLISREAFVVASELFELAAMHSKVWGHTINILTYQQ